MHFFVTQLFSIAIITETYVCRVQNLRPMNRLIINISYAKMQATAARALTRDATVV